MDRHTYSTCKWAVCGLHLSLYPSSFGPFFPLTCKPLSCSEPERHESRSKPQVQGASCSVTSAVRLQRLLELSAFRTARCTSWCHIPTSLQQTATMRQHNRPRHGCRRCRLPAQAGDGAAASWAGPRAQRCCSASFTHAPAISLTRAPPSQRACEQPSRALSATSGSGTRPRWPATFVHT